VGEVATTKVKRRLVPRAQRASRTGKRVLARLTPRELQVLQLVCVGESNREIANRLLLSTQVVKNYVKSIFRKTSSREERKGKVKDRVKLAIFAYYHRMVQCPCRASRTAEKARANDAA
jgi:DNA-binding NarL/FixJ family response regulator